MEKPQRSLFRFVVHRPRKAGYVEGVRSQAQVIILPIRILHPCRINTLSSLPVPGQDPEGNALRFSDRTCGPQPVRQRQ